MAHCDNMVVVEVINSGCSKDAIMMHLLKTLFFIRAHWKIVVRAEHIPGRQNRLAIAISRNNLGAQAPQASRIPTRVFLEIQAANDHSSRLDVANLVPTARI